MGQGQYSQSYGYDPATGNLASKNDVGAYSYLPAKPHAVTSAGAMNYQYDANGNMVSRNGQLISYDAENHLTAFAGKTWLYDGDGKRVAEINADGTATIFIGNYFEGAYPEPEPPAQPPQPNKVYLPIVLKGGVSFEPITARMGTLYFYADGQRIAMKKDGVVYYLYGDQLGSVSAVADGSGALISQTLYHPWGTTRHTQGTSPTDYAYTGQMQEGDIYFYNARWPKVPATQWRGYDPQLGRFMQADTLVPPTQGTQGFDRYAYINNNPVNGTDPTGMWMCGDQYDLACYETTKEFASFYAMDSYYIQNLPVKYYASYSGLTNQPPISLIAAFTEKSIIDFSFDPFIEQLDMQNLMNKTADDISKKPFLIRRDPRRGGYDTPFFSGGGMSMVSKLLGLSPVPDVYPSSQQVCLVYLGCFSRTELNYYAQGMWDAAANATLDQAYKIAMDWKRIMYDQETISEGTKRIIEFGFYFYKAWERFSNHD